MWGAYATIAGLVLWFLAGPRFGCHVLIPDATGTVIAAMALLAAGPIMMARVWRGAGVCRIGAPSRLLAAGVGLTIVTAAVAAGSAFMIWIWAPLWMGILTPLPAGMLLVGATRGAVRLQGSIVWGPSLATLAATAALLYMALGFMAVAGEDHMCFPD